MVVSNPWWISDPEQRYWMEIRQPYEGMGTDLRCPAGPKWSNELVSYIQPGDRILHWKTGETDLQPAMVGWSEATGPAAQKREQYEPDEPEILVWKVPLGGLRRFPRPVTSASLLPLLDQLMDLKDQLETEHGKPIYFPWKRYRGSEIYAQQGYCVKFPVELFDLIPDIGSARLGTTALSVDDVDVAEDYQPRGVQLDRRDFSYDAVAEAAAGLEPMGATPDLDPFTGSIRRLSFSTHGLEHLSTRLTAMELARRASVEASGFSDSEPAEFGLPQDVRTTSAGAQVVHLQQLHRGIPVFQSGRTVQLRPSGQAAVTGAAVEALHRSESEPRLGARDAVVAAARFVAVADGDASGHDHGLTGTPAVRPLVLPDDFQPVQTATFDLPAQPTTFSAEPFEGPVKASLVYLYMGPDVRLTWQVELVYPQAAADYAVLVAAGENKPGEILYAADRASNLLGECAIHAHNPSDSQPASTPFPLPACSLPKTLSPATPRDWIDAQPVTSGNNVVCRTEGGPGLVSGVLNGGLVTFGPFSLESRENYVAHTFYYCNVMHDFFEALGFDERSGNFQLVNFSGAPGGGDPVDATVFDGEVEGTASMLTRPDGQSPTMKMGLVVESNRHTALDSEVVFHEYTHGVTRRLVGGLLDQNSLAQDQSRGMGEGWSDFFALTFHNVARGPDKLVIGDWVKNDPDGLRGFPYGDAFPDKFDAVGKGRYRRPHPIGEIWCATLMMATRDLTATLVDKPRAYAITWQCVVDGLKLTPANPSFLDARDAISDAIDDLRAGGLITEAECKATRRSFWKAFAHFRMGTKASCRGASLLNIVGDDTLPADVEFAPQIDEQQAVVDELTVQRQEARMSNYLACLLWAGAETNGRPPEEIKRLKDDVSRYGQQLADADLALEQAKRRLEELKKGRP
jgi:extracellular elastinolytic metalloproteinase